MNRVIFIVIVIGFVTSCNNSESSISEVKEFYDNGNIKSIIRNRNDKRHDTTFYFYPTGELEKLEYYEDGEIKGEVLTFFENGIISNKYIYNDNQIIKEYSYDSFGELINEYKSLKINELDSLWFNFVAKNADESGLYLLNIKSNIPIGNILPVIPNATLKKTNVLGQYSVSSEKNIDTLEIAINLIVNDTSILYHDSFLISIEN